MIYTATRELFLADGSRGGSEHSVDVRYTYKLNSGRAATGMSPSEAASVEIVNFEVCLNGSWKECDVMHDLCLDVFGGVDGVSEWLLSQAERDAAADYGPGL